MTPPTSPPKSSRTALWIALAAGAVVLILACCAGAVGIYVYVKDATRSVAENPAAAPSASPPAAQGAFPVVPADADPALKTKPAVATPAGTVTSLNVKTLIQGKGTPAAAGKKITVNYVGASFKDGAEFDSSWKRSQPFEFTLGIGSVIKGFDEGLLGVKTGSRVQLDIPPDKAYGDNPGGGQPGGALRFVVDVLSVS